MRTTKGQIIDTERIINRLLEKHGYFHRIYVEWAYGQPRVYQVDENKSRYAELSPRDRTGIILLWLNAYLKGLQMGLLENAK